MRTILLVLLAVLIAFAAFAASELRSGVWTAELDADGLNVTLFQGRHHGSVMSLTVQMPRLTGLTAEAVNGGGAEVKFALVRAAGVFAFDGHFAAGKGAGHFTFTPDASFLRDMEQLGFTTFSDDELLVFASEDFRPVSVKELRAMGYEIRRSDLEEIAVFGITPEYVRKMHAIGVRDLHRMVELKATGADAILLRSPAR